MRPLRLRGNVPKRTSSVCNFTSTPRNPILANPAWTRFDEPGWKIIEEGCIGWIAAKGVLSLLWSLHRPNRTAVYIINIGLCRSVLVLGCAIPDRIPRREPRERSGNKLNCAIPRSVRSRHGSSVMGWKPISDRNHPSSLSVKRGEASQLGVPVISIFGQFRIAPVRIHSRGFHLNHKSSPGDIWDWLPRRYISGIDRRSRNGNFPETTTSLLYGKSLGRCSELRTADPWTASCINIWTAETKKRPTSEIWYRRGKEIYLIKFTFKVQLIKFDWKFYIH